MPFVLPASRTKSAFTLVELLVVIGIIAVLISILLPSLARARQAANTVSCLSNLRQVGQAFQLYASDNKGFLPLGEGPDLTVTGAPYTRLWVHEVSAVLGTDVGSNGLVLAPVFRCPQAVTMEGVTSETFKFHYSVNPRLMPSVNAAAPGYQLDASSAATPVWRQLATIKDSSSKMLMWDGAQISTANNNAAIRSWGLDGGQWSAAAGHHFCDPADTGYDDSQLDQPIAIGSNPANDLQSNRLANKDGDTEGECVMRFRHNSDRTLNILYCDGHADSRELNSVMRREVCVNR